MPYPPYSQGESFRTLVHDRLGPRQSSQSQQAPPVRPVALDRSDRSHQRPVQFRSPRLEYCAKEKKDDVQPMQVDSGKAIVHNIVQIGDVNVVVK